MNELFQNSEPYILNEANMQNYLKYKLVNLHEHKNKVKNENSSHSRYAH
jgi:hypothetical protein